MIIRKISIWSGKLHSIELPITEAELQEWRTGKKLVQEMFPHLAPWQREYLINGMTQEEWDDAFGKADEDTWEMIGWRDHE